ncbi:SRPBCC family protein [Mumia sp. zg.B17]|uniref:SRPBCC family protein n=1 Tax=Mumia sp. zg.B17 TaxID=2855446 RepID=UPI001C6DF737|nr:SRPBCC family protein [Mumia sp. zg.B17]MBW9206700.1 SRPBCC family protein [Mumia sp. zg.B17]
MTQYTATRVLRATQKTVLEILLDIGQLPDWNPAVHSIVTDDQIAALGKRYPAATRLPGRAFVTYTHIQADGVVWRLEAPGAVEEGRWRITDLGRTSEVTHTMVHTGPVFMLLRHTMRAVPDLRLDRLRLRAEGGHASALHATPASGIVLGGRVAPASPGDDVEL